MNPDIRAIGRYEIRARVGRGGMGVLYRGRDPVLDREVAIKVLSEELGADEAATERFFREARAAAKLQHRNIVTIFDFAQDGHLPYIVMEFLRGRSLATRMRESPPLTRPEQVALLIQLCTGLQFAHSQGVVHRDVKPGNVWLLPDGTVKLLDFGIAKVASTTLSRGTDIVGSAAYMSPEQIGGRPIDGRADVFSAGVVLYELLSGRRPFQGESPTAVMMRIIKEDPPPIEQLVPDLPPALGAALRRAMSKDLAQRYASAGDFAADLQAASIALLPAQPETEFDLGETSIIPTPTALPETQYAISDHPTGNMHALSASSVGLHATDATATVPAQPAPWWNTVPKIVWAAGAGSVLILVAFLGTLIPRSPSAGPPARVTTGAPPPVEAPQSAPPAPLPEPVATPTPATASPVPTLDHAPATTPVGVSVTVSSDPSGAAISIDGRDTKLVTPAAVRIDGKLPVQVRLSKPGFAAMSALITEADAQAQALSVKLLPEKSRQQREATVSVQGAYDFAVLDEQGRQLSPRGKLHAIAVDGRRTVRLSAPEYMLNQSVTLEAGRSRQAPALGRLIVKLGSAVEDCGVAIRGRTFAPFEEHRIAAGSYVVDVTCPTGSDRKEKVTVQPGQVTSLPVR